MKFIFIVALLVAPSSAFSQAMPSTPNYGNAQPVPRAFAQALMNRGLSASQVVGTMNGIASVAVNDNAAIAATNATRVAAGMRVASWLALAARSANIVGAGLTALQIGIAGYQYFFSKSSGNNQNAAQFTAQNASPSAPTYPNSVQAGTDYVLDNWYGNYFLCGPSANPYSCALAEAKVAAIEWINLIVLQNRGMHISIMSYSSECPEEKSGYKVYCEIHIVVKRTENNGSSQIIEGSANGLMKAYYRKKSDINDVAKPICLGWQNAGIYCQGNPDSVQLPEYIPYPMVEIPFFLPSDRRAEVAKPQVPADLMNDLWRRAAAANGYAGVPYPMNDPMTAAELAPSRLTVGELSQPVVDPAASPSSSTMPWAPSVPAWPQGNPNYVDGQVPPTYTQPSANTGSDASTNPSNGSSQTQTRTEPDPGVPKPSDPDVPTIDKILSPIWKFAENRKTFNTPTTSRECPLVSFTLWEKKIESRVHCDMIESVRPQIEALFIFAWILGTYLIVLSA